MLMTLRRIKMNISEHVLELLKERLRSRKLRRVLSHYDYVRELDGAENFSNYMQQNRLNSSMYDTYCLLNFGYVYPIYWNTGEGGIEIYDSHDVKVDEEHITGNDSNIIDESLERRQFSGEIFE